MKYLKFSFIFLGLIFTFLSFATEIQIELDEKGYYKDSIEIKKEHPYDIHLIEGQNEYKLPSGIDEIHYNRTIHLNIIGDTIKIGDIYLIDDYIYEAIEDSKIEVKILSEYLSTSITISNLNRVDYAKVTIRYHGIGFNPEDKSTLNPNATYMEEIKWERKDEYEDGYSLQNTVCAHYYEFDLTRIRINNKELSSETFDEESGDIFVYLDEDVVIDLYAKNILGNSHFDEFDPKDNIISGATELKLNQVVSRTIGEADYADWYKVKLKAGLSYKVLTNAYFKDCVTYTEEDGFDYVDFDYTKNINTCEIKADKTAFYYFYVRFEYDEDKIPFKEYQLICEETTSLDAEDPTDDTPTGATPIYLNGILQEIENRKVGGIDPCDWFKVELKEDIPYSFYTTSPNYGVKHSLYFIPENSKNENDYELINKEDDMLYKVQTAGTYYIKVTSWGGNEEYTLFYTTNKEFVKEPEVIKDIAVNPKNIYSKYDAGSITITNQSDEVKELRIVSNDEWINFESPTLNSISITMSPKSTKYMNIYFDSLPDGTDKREGNIDIENAAVNSKIEAKIPVYQFKEFPNKLIVENGSGGGHYAPNSVVTIVSNSPPVGKIFDQWVFESNNAYIKNPKISITSLTLLGEECKVTARYKDIPKPTPEPDPMPKPADKTIQLLSANPSKTEYFTGESDTVLINANASTDPVLLKCSGLTYGVDFIISGHAPDGNNFNMTINDLRKGVLLSFLKNSGKKSLRITVTSKGWSIDNDHKELIYNITSKESSFSSLTSNSKNKISIKDQKDFNYESGNVINTHTNSGIYTKSDGVFKPNNNATFGWLDVLIDNDGNNLYIYSGSKKAPNQEMTIDATKISEMNGGEFVKKPAFKNLTLDPYSKTPLKPKKTAITFKNDTLTFKPTTKLYNAIQIKLDRTSGKMIGSYTKCDSQRGSQIVFTYKDKDEQIIVKDAPMGAIIISAPEELKLVKSFTSSNGKDSILRVSGNFLGTKPKAFYEYKDKNDKVKTANCKVKLFKKAGLDQAKESIESQFDTDSGYKTMDVTLPTLPKGAKSTPFHFIIDNGIGYGEFMNAPAPKIKQ